MCMVVCYDLPVLYLCCCIKIYRHVNIDVHMCQECACDLSMPISSAIYVSILVGGSKGERGSEGWHMLPFPWPGPQTT